MHSAAVSTGPAAQARNRSILADKYRAGPGLLGGCRMSLAGQKASEGLGRAANLLRGLLRDNKTVGLALKLASGAVFLSLVVEGGRIIKRRAEHQRLKAEQGKKEAAVNQVLVAVLTGGPCGGKTSAMTYLKEAFERLGITVLVVPEVPTILMEGGAVYPGRDAGKKLIEFETHLLKLQLQIENSFLGIGRSLDRPVVVMCDRGALDISAYVYPHDWSATLTAAGVLPGDLLRRYHMVVHMITAAEGAEQFYTLANNTARSEDAKAARNLDKLVRMSWSGHPRLVVVDNSTAFQGKVERVFEAVLAEARRMGMVPPSVATPTSSSKASSASPSA